jgi:hypothetical protein
MARPQCDTPLLLLYVLFVTLRFEIPPNRGALGTLSAFKKPLMNRGAHEYGLVMFRLTMQELLNFEQFFSLKI